VPTSVELAKQVLEDNQNVLYGVFGHVATSPWFPPARFLNEFLGVGHDPCDQDERMGHWKPFALTNDEYEEVKRWWLTNHPNSNEDELGVSSWDEWVFHLLHGQYE
jgi:hypothetical protein